MLARKSGTPLKLTLITALALVALAGFLVAPLAPAYAATAMPTITPIGINPGEEVQIRVSNLPADTDFTVTMSAAGQQGFGPVIAHFNSDTGGTRTYWFEILSTLRNEAKVEVRIDSGTGIFAFAAFDNTQAVLSPGAPTPTPASTAVPEVAPIPAPVMGTIHVIHVQQGGIVVAELKNMPLDTQFSVTVGKAGSQGFGGYKVGSISSESLSDHIGYFEIPVELSAEPSLDLRIEARGTLYLVTFSNTNF